MLLAVRLSPDKTVFQVLLVLHLITAFVAFAPGFVWPAISSAFRRKGQSIGPDLSAVAAKTTLRVQGTAAVLTGLFGFGLVSTSKLGNADEAYYGFDQTWIQIALLLWFVLLGVVYVLLYPALRKAADGDESSEPRVPMFTGIVHLLLVLLIIDMVWKPGL